MAANPEPKSDPSEMSRYINPADGIFGGAAPGLPYEGGTWEPENAPRPQSEPAAMRHLSSPSRPFPQGQKRGGPYTDVMGTNGTTYSTSMGDAHITGGRDQANR